jgi:hypothetical protein
MATVLAYPTIVTFTPVTGLIEGTGDAKSLVTTSDIVADIVARGGLSLCGSENCQCQNEISE